MELKKYRLFAEWADAALYGETLEDAIMREGTLLAWTPPSGPGAPSCLETMKVAEVLDTQVASCTSRGGHEIERAVVEFCGGRIREVDAFVERTLHVFPASEGGVLA